MLYLPHKKGDKFVIFVQFIVFVDVKLVKFPMKPLLSITESQVYMKDYNISVMQLWLVNVRRHDIPCGT